MTVCLNNINWENELVDINTLLQSPDWIRLCPCDIASIWVLTKYFAAKKENRYFHSQTNSNINQLVRIHSYMRLLNNMANRQGFVLNFCKHCHPLAGSKTESWDLWKTWDNLEQLNAMAQLLGQHSGTTWAGQLDEHEHSVFQSLLQSLLAATCSLKENLLPNLWCWVRFNAL